MIFGDPECIFENDVNDERMGGGIYLLFSSAIAIVPGRGSYPLRGEYSPRGTLDLFWAKIGFRIQWSWSQVLKVPGTPLILGF